MLSALLATPAVGGPPYAGRPLAAVLEDLRAQGIDLVFTDAVVDPSVRVAREPSAREPRAVLDEILAAHELAVRLVGGRLVVIRRPGHGTAILVVRDRKSGAPLAGALVAGAGVTTPRATGSEGRLTLRLPAGPTTLLVEHAGFAPRRFEVTVVGGEERTVVAALEPLPVTLDEIVVTPSRSFLLSERLSAVVLDRGTVDSLPRAGNDILRSITLLPGTAGDETTARFSVRGGRYDQVLVLLDGVELLEPFHLKDFNSALSILAPDILDRAELLTGGFPAEYGDRSSAVLDLVSREPGTSVEGQLALSVFDLQALVGGPWHGGGALVSARAGSLEPVLQLADEVENPRFADAFGRLDLPAGSRHGGRLQALLSGDDLDFVESDDDFTQDFRTRDLNAYLWGSHQATIGDSLVLEGRLTATYLTRDRRGGEQDERDRLRVVDDRWARIAKLEEQASWSASDRHQLRLGLEVAHLAARYDYANDRDLRDPLAAVRHLPATGSARLETELDGFKVGVFVSDRWRWRDDLVVEAGVRYDERTVSDDEHVSPRLSLVWTPRSAGTWRAAWGYFYQAHRLHELRVEDGEGALQRAERAEHRILGWDRDLFGGAVRLRAEVYERRVDDPRVRYLNLFDPISLVPELEPDRVRVAPARGRGRGLELTLRSRPGRRVDWFVTYARSRAEEHLDGRWVRRENDQPHAVRADVDFTLPADLRLNVAYRYHTGWPTTAIGARRGDPDLGEREIVPVLGPRNAERLPDSHRMDLRLSRDWPAGRGTLTAFLEVQNVYNHRNALGYEIDLDLAEDGGPVAVRDPVLGSKRVPWFGVRWRY